MNVAPYSQRWLEMALCDVGRARRQVGAPWFDHKAVAKRYAREVEMNAMIGRGAVRAVLYGIVRVSEVGPHNLLAMKPAGNS